MKNKAETLFKIAHARTACVVAFACLSISGRACRADVPKVESFGLPAAVTAEKWVRMERAVDRGLAWLAENQSADGSIRGGLAVAQPGVTSLGVMAFLSAGHVPGVGPYGDTLDRAVRYTLSTQQADGLLSSRVPLPFFDIRQPSHVGNYNHLIAGTMLCEVYGLTDAETNGLIDEAVVRALARCRRDQARARRREEDRGGIRYPAVKPGEEDSDLSLAAWMLTFYRSARNAEFPVPEEYVDEGVAYVRRCANHGAARRNGVFQYAVRRSNKALRSMTAAGALALALSGRHDDPLIAEAGDWLMAHPTRRYDGVQRYFYGAYYRSQAMGQLGGRYWTSFYRQHVDEMLAGQEPGGAWASRKEQSSVWGRGYTTSMAILSLTPSYQLLPIYQR